MTLAACAFGAPCLRAQAQPFVPLPQPVTNNAVAQLQRDGHTIIYSLMGMGAGKTWADITRAAYSLELGAGSWTRLPDVPGAAGRIAAVAAGVGGKVYLFGGYSVDAKGAETTWPNVDIYDPATNAWTRGADIPVPVDDSVLGVYLERYIYLTSGWSVNDNVANVQVYDTATNHWRQATKIAGTPVFGHAGGISGSTIVYCNGAYKNPAARVARPGAPAPPKYVASEECWQGRIDRHDETLIVWKAIPSHPGAARYRMAAAGNDLSGHVFFLGGTDNPYNYNGIGYDGRPAEPARNIFAWDTGAEAWDREFSDDAPSMDHRGLIVVASELDSEGKLCDSKGRPLSATIRMELLATVGGMGPSRLVLNGLTERLGQDVVLCLKPLTH